GQLDAFHVQLEEISSSRDEALLKEKRIRRYLLRIMAGQAKEDVLRVMLACRCFFFVLGTAKMYLIKLFHFSFHLLGC
ncbi:MAG: hypothetical protein ACK53Y_06250, partial [bacterium]